MQTIIIGPPPTERSEAVTHHVTRAVNIDVFVTTNQQPITRGGTVGDHITLLDRTTGHEVTMDRLMFDYIVHVLGDASC